MPVVSSAVLTDSATITFTGINFFTEGYTAQASFNAIWADDVSITDATTVVAKWNKGVPTVGNEMGPVLKFTKTEAVPSGDGRRLETVSSSPLTHFAASSVLLTNPLDITASTSGL